LKRSTETTKGIQAQLFLWDDRFLWVSDSFKGQMTRRYATNVVLAIGDNSFLLQQPEAKPERSQGAICKARAMRCLDATDVPFLSLNLDPGTRDAVLLEHTLAGLDVAMVDRRRFASLDQELAQLLAGELSIAAARQLTDRIVSTLTQRVAQPAEIDERVQFVARLLRTTLPVDIDTESLASGVGLSAMRLMHLFSDQIGMPMSSYLLWAKMRRAVSLVQGGRSLTEIAQTCGFADSSHLTRTFQAFYAIKPSLLADSSYVQVRLG
jgi:AraC-like DNA-binding protein